MSIVEVEFSACDARTFRSALLERGGILLRNAIHPNKVAFFKAQLLDPALAFYSDLTEEQIEAQSPERWWGGANPMSFYQYQLRHGYVSDVMLAQATGGVGSYYDLISDPRFHELVSLAFPGRAFRRSPVAHCRRVKDRDPGKGWAKPETMHCDLRYHRDTLFALNFWVPFEPSGEAHRSPGLEIAAVDLRTVASYLEYDPHTSALFNEAKFERSIIVAAFGEQCMSRPVLAPGDVLVFTNWTLHGTYLSPLMTRGRLSAEVRLAGDNSVADELILR
jgi:hypothetical protein